MLLLGVNMQTLASLSLALGTLALGATTVAAEGRDGLVLGASLDGGNIGCQTRSGADCGGGVKAAGGFTFHIGGMVKPDLAVVAELWGMSHDDGNVSASQSLLTANARGWLTPRFWLQGGLGAARSRITYPTGTFMYASASDVAPAIAVAGGYEVLHAKTFAIDVQLRAGSAMYRGDARVYNAALGIGVSWF